MSTRYPEQAPRREGKGFEIVDFRPKKFKPVTL